MAGGGGVILCYRIMELSVLLTVEADVYLNKISDVWRMKNLSIKTQTPAMPRLIESQRTAAMLKHWTETLLCHFVCWSCDPFLYCLHESNYQCIFHKTLFLVGLAKSHFLMFCLLQTVYVNWFAGLFRFSFRGLIHLLIMHIVCRTHVVQLSECAKSAQFQFA